MRVPWQRRRDQQDSALDEEIRAHLAMASADRVARGESPDHALAAAKREFGNVGHVKEVTREMWGGLWVERLLQDLRYAGRSLRRTPGFAVIAVLTLALGIGVNAAMFTVMDGVLLKPLPYPEPGRLYLVSYAAPRGPRGAIDGLFDRDFLAVEHDSAIFAQLTTFSSRPMILRLGDEPARVTVGEVTTGFFPTFGVHAAIGRTFAPDDHARGVDNLVVLSERCWRNRFHADSSVIGRPISLDGASYRVIGVMPPTFVDGGHDDLWIPMTIRLDPHNSRIRTTLGRLKPTMTRARADAAWRSLTGNLEAIRGLERTGLVPQLVPLQDSVVADARPALLLFTGAVVFVLFVACANVANLMLMRVTSRSREMAVRAALGAGRTRLVRQLLTETLVIAGLGAVVGTGFAVVAVRALLALAPGDSVPRAESVSIDARVLVFTVCVTLLTTVLCGLVPALHITEKRLRPSLVGGGRGVTDTHGRLRATLAVGEIALALILLTGAGLLLRSYHALRSIPLGFDASRMLTTTAELSGGRYDSANALRAHHEDVLERLASLPGVTAAGAINWRPLGDMLVSGDFSIENGPTRSSDYADKIVVSPDYFRAAGMKIESGRAFDSGDRMTAPSVVIVSRSLASRFWPAGDAVGKRMSMSSKPAASDWMTIVGIVGDVVQHRISSQPSAAIYQPLAQTAGAFFLSRMTYVVRPSANSMSLALAMRRAIREADPAIPVEPVTTMADLVNWTIVEPQFEMRMLVTFATLALLLATIGIYGVLSYGVAQRFREIGVRMALGARRTDVTTMVATQTASLVVPGLVLGIAGSYATTRLLTHSLFHVTPTDPITFLAVAMLLLFVAFAAALIPARRAGAVDPVIALRAD